MLAAGLAVGLAGCGRASPVAAADDVLVLEVGGDAPSLRVQLRALGREVGPGHRLADPFGLADPFAPGGPLDKVAPQPAPQPGVDPAPVEPQPDEPRPVVPGPVEPGPVEPGPVEPGPVAPTPPEWTFVELGDGERLIHLARRHLGDGRRYTELLEWNGWTENDARRLPVGQKVRVLTRELRR